ncbi:VCBS domain-containing protein, partial [Mesorhizobium sp. B2-3-4]|uniref:beta strand repeat-containing protein n=1 Tax=Mesorhizobium sp. B2-3-4 TaxID=2589959 RepID=UPI0011680A7C
MATSIELDNLSGSWEEHSVSNDHHDLTVPSQVVAQAAPAEQAPAAAQTTPASSEPVPVDVGAGAPAATPPAANAPHEYVADASNVVRLPANVSIDNIKVDGHNLLLQQADGSVIVIKDGALNVPTFIIGDVEVPRVALIAALEGSHVDVAFGADGSMSAGPGGSTSSAGGNFEQPAGGIGDGFGLSALLPPTDLQFGTLDRRELFLGVAEKNATPSIDLTGEATVHEAGLPSRGGEPAGSDSASDSETTSGTIGFTSPDGVSEVTLGGHVLTGIPQIFSDATGSLTASYVFDAATGTGTISYSYTLADNTSGDNTSVNFPIGVTDGNGDPAPPGNLIINIVDDVPTAHADSNDVTEGALLTVAAAAGVLVNDVSGADGATIDGVRAAGGNTTAAVSGGVGTDIAGLHGTLHLNADGSYTYQSTANNITSATTDVFVYTIKDGDGDLSTTTLTIHLSDSGLVAPADSDVTVDEAALDTSTTGADLTHGTVTGSLPGSPAETDATNQLNASGGVGALTYTEQTTAGTYGTIHINTDGSYVYTLTSNHLNAEANDGVQTISGLENFTYTVTDSVGNSTTGTITVNIVDDVPTAHADSNDVTEGALLTVAAAAGVLVNDVSGADGATIDGVRAAGGNTTAAVSGGVGTDIAGLHGTLHLNADGSYTYQATANNISSATTDVFVYTIKDGDGDLSTTTLTIHLSDSGLVAPADSDVTVDEAALDTSTTGADLTHGTVTGSLPGSPAETDATNQLNASGGVGALTYTEQTTAGTYGTIHINTDGSYVYTLTSNHLNAEANDGVQTISGLENFTYTVTDSVGNSTTGTITVNIIDDVPKAIGTAQLTANVDEDGLHNAQSTGNVDNPQPDGEVAGTNSAIATGAAGALNLLVDFGADGPHPTSAFGLITQAAPSDSGVDSKGADVLIVSDGTTLTGYVDVGGGTGYQAGTDRPVFTLTVGANGSYVFTLIDQIDHPTLNGVAGDNTENTLANGGIDFSSFIVAKDGDGDTVALADGTFKVQVLDDVPQITARDANTTTTTTTETIVYTLQAGNTDVRGMDGAGNHDIKLTGVDVNEGDNSVNTTGTKIGIGDGQIIDGYETHPGVTGPEILTLDFVNNLVVTPHNPNPPTVTDSGSYDVSSVSFTIDVAEAKGIESAVLFIGAKDGGVFEPFTVNVNGVLTSGTAVFEGGVQVGYAFAGVPDGATVDVIGSTPFDQLKVGNYNNFTFDSNAGGTDATLSGGNPFKIFGIEAKITTVTTQTEVFHVSHDESAGVNNAADPNPADDTALPPPALVQEADAIGYAKSSASALGLFTASVGADENASFSFAVTDANGNALVNVNSGLKTLDGSTILLSTNADGVLVGSANGVDVFKVYVDPTGAVWIGQYQPIAHGVAGGSAAAFDDIATVAADLHVKATITDFDGDSSTAVSHVALSIEFQDDGPVAVDDQDSVTEDGPLTADGNVVTGTGGSDANITDGQADHLGSDGFGAIAWDGAVANHVNGIYGQLTVGTDGSYSYVLYTQAQNPAAYAAVQGLSAGQSLSENFGYTVSDGDGDTAPASLTITVNGADDITTISGLTAQSEGGDATVDEKGLAPRGSEPAGSGELADSNPNNNSDHSETAGGTFAFSSPDGLGTLQVGTTSITYAALANSGSVPIVIAGGPAYGTLTITGFSGTNAGGTVTYSFTLTDNIAHPTAGSTGAADQLFANYGVTVTDEDGSSSNSTLSIAINDDGPVAVNDGVLASHAENVAGLTIGTVAGILANDHYGADGAAAANAITIGAGD